MAKAEVGMQTEWGALGRSSEVTERGAQTLRK